MLVAALVALEPAPKQQTLRQLAVLVAAAMVAGVQPIQMLLVKTQLDTALVVAVVLTIKTRLPFLALAVMGRRVLLLLAMQAAKPCMAEPLQRLVVTLFTPSLQTTFLPHFRKHQLFLSRNLLLAAAAAALTIMLVAVLVVSKLTQSVLLLAQLT
jgi:hypothetical protein